MARKPLPRTKHKMCSKCGNYTNQVAIRSNNWIGKGSGSFKEIGRGCFNCREIIITNQRGFNIVFSEILVDNSVNRSE